MQKKLIDQFNIETEVEFKDDMYLVRDNGSVLRKSRLNYRRRANDDNWSFGKKNNSTGYMLFSSQRVHRIVALAFHGKPPTDQHVVDHIDTNRCNNRSENLRWLTKLENALLNPITTKRIESICKCNIEEFLVNPQKYRDLLSNSPPDIQWMRAVSNEEGKECLENLTNWAKTDKPLLGKTLGEWIYHRNDVYSEERVERVFEQVEKKTGISKLTLCSNKAMIGDYYEARKYSAKLLRSELNLSDYEIGKIIGLSAITVNQYLEVCADGYSEDYVEVRDKQHKILSEQSNKIPKNVIQKNWTSQSEFPSCPKKVLNYPITEYFEKLEVNTVFFRNSYSFTNIIQSTIIDRGKSILVMYEITKNKSTEKRWGIMKIIFENEKFVHEIIPNYNKTLEHYWLIDVDNHFNSIAEGCEWTPLYDSQGREYKRDYMPL